MAHLPTLDKVARLSRYVSRVLENNSGPFTLQGTNTYLISAAKNIILLDTGEGKPEYLERLDETLQGYPKGAEITDIIFSHWHKDHTTGIINLLKHLRQNRKQTSRPKIHKWISGNDESHLLELLESEPDIDSLITLPHYSEASDVKRYDILKYVFPIEDEQTFNVDSATGIVLKSLYTPGHTDDSVSFLLDTNDQRYVFTGDTVLGHGTTIFTDLTKYMKSLDKLKNLLEERNGVLYPGHGSIVNNGLDLIMQYIEARNGRESQIMHYLNNASDPVTVQDLLGYIYGGSLPERVVPAASYSILQHLKKLLDDRAVREIEQENGSVWTLANVQKI